MTRAVRDYLASCAEGLQALPEGRQSARARISRSWMRFASAGVTPARKFTNQSWRRNPEIEPDFGPLPETGPKGRD